MFLARIKAFRFEWTDAWFNIHEGYDTILELSDSGIVTIQFLVNGKPFILDLTEREDEFITDMKILKKWNKRVYINNNVLDGTMWNLYFTYDNTAIVSRGRNGFPSNFLDYLNILHQKYSVPEAKFENDKWIMQDIKHTKIIDSPDIDSWAMYL